MAKTLRRRPWILALLLVSACSRPLLREEPSVGPRLGAHRRFRVVSSAAEVAIRRDLPLAEISGLPGAARPGLRTQGLTLIKHSLATHTRFRTATDESKVSAWFDDVILELRLSSVTIHIPREYRPGSCEHEAILRHELGHVEQARRSVSAAARRLEAVLADVQGLPTSAQPLLASDFDSAAAALRSRISFLVDPVYRDFEESEAAAQAALDHPDPYDSVYRSCSGWR